MVWASILHIGKTFRKREFLCYLRRILEPLLLAWRVGEPASRLYVDSKRVPYWGYDTYSSFKLLVASY